MKIAQNISDVVGSQVGATSIEEMIELDAECSRLNKADAVLYKRELWLMELARVQLNQRAVK
jgi:hypothetical protein